MISKKDSPIISVIVPVYNSEKSIRYCVDSIINQTYKYWNLILVNDGSTDTSPGICDEYADSYSNITVIHKSNGGVSSARNVGMEAVESDFLVFIDSDDFVSKDYLESLINTYISNPEVGHIWCTFNTTNSYSCNYNCDDASVEKYSRNQLVDLIFKWCVQGPYCKLYKTDIIKGRLKMDESLDLGEDLLFNLSYLNSVDSEDIIVINNNSYHYFIGDSESLDHKYRENYYEITLYLNNKIFEYINEWNLSEEQIQKYYNYCLGTFINVFSNTMDKRNKQSFFKKIATNNSYLNSPEFITTLNESDCYINPFVKIGYKTKNYFLVYIIERLSNLKNRG